MISSFPLVRASDIAPFVRWVQKNGRSLDDVLACGGLSAPPWDATARPISLIKALSVMRMLSLQEGPDIATRVVTDTSILDLGELGQLMLGGRTPREALTLVCEAMPRHCTHEFLTITPAAEGAFIREELTLDVDDVTRHTVQQYVAALIRSLCKMTGYAGEPLSKIELTPHPEFGLSHLNGSLGPELTPSATNALTVFISDDVLDRAFPSSIRKFGGDWPKDHWDPLYSANSFACTARAFIDFMLDDGEPTVERFAEASGFSVRTSQRRLAAEGTSFSDLLDEARRARALVALSGSSKSITHVAADLGYSGQPSFVRAVRRWTGVSPRRYRNGAV